MLRLEPASLEPPPGLNELLADLGDGENGFGGSPVFSGEMSVEAYLRHCTQALDPARLSAGYVPRTVFWALDAEGKAIGIVRLRHYLNEKLLVYGGHVGYYVHRSQRGKGYGKLMLKLALAELRRLGEKRALITVHVDNLPSIRVIEANGGRLSDVRTDPDTGAAYRRYWIDLEP